MRHALIVALDMATAHRVAAGDRAAFDLLMRRNNRRLYRLARATQDGVDRLGRVGVTCALCHSTVDDSFARALSAQEIADLAKYLKSL